MVDRSSFSTINHGMGYTGHILCDRCGKELDTEYLDFHVTSEFEGTDNPNRKVSLCTTCKNEIIKNWYTANGIRLGSNAFAGTDFIED